MIYPLSAQHDDHTKNGKCDCAEEACPPEKRCCPRAECGNMACGCALEKPVHGARIILRCQPGWDVVMEIKIPSIFGRCKIIHPGQNTDEMPGNAVIRHNCGNESHPQNHAQFRWCEHERGQGTARDDVQYGQGQEWEKQCEREMAAADIGAAHVVGHPLVPQDG